MATCSATAADQKQEMLQCAASPVYFAHKRCWIYDPRGEWLRFRLWPAQVVAMKSLVDHRLNIWLKARQLGMTWLALSFALHTLLFRPGSTVLLFSRRDDEATDLLSRQRLRGMYDRLPSYLQVRGENGNSHEWVLSNGSRAMCFPTTAGDSYSATLAIVDEADLVPNLDKLLGAVKPTIDAGGRLLLLSRPDKDKPESPFKRIYRSAVMKQNGWHPTFLPWNARPDRDAAWYADQKADSLGRTGSIDSLWEQYPSTDVEALACRTLDKRFSPEWLTQYYQQNAPLQLSELSGCPAIPGLTVYKLPEEGLDYCIGADPAEGNPTSDDSALCILEKETGEQVAEVQGKIEPTVLGHYIFVLSTFYNRAAAMVERNNHGHAVLGWLRANGYVRCLKGHDGSRGWLSSAPGKVRLYDWAADCFRDRLAVVRSFSAYVQLASIEGETLRAPEGQYDDLADAYVLALVGLPKAGHRSWKAETIGADD